MAKKDWVDRAAESGDWTPAIDKSAAALRKSGTAITRARAPKDEPETVGRFEGLEPDAPEPADTSADAVQEYVEDAPQDDEEEDLTLSDEAERAIVRAATSEAEPVNVELTPTQQRKAALAAKAEAERQRILAHQAERKLKQAAELERYRAEQERYIGAALSLMIEMEERADARVEKWLARRVPISEEEIWDRILHPWHGRDAWAGVSNFRRSGPPPDPPFDRWAMPHPVATNTEMWRYRHRGVLSALRRSDDELLRFGHPPNPGMVPVQDPYYGYKPRAPGRPPKADKLSNAAKQRAYRDRLRARKANT